MGGQTAHGAFGKRVGYIVRDIKLLAFVGVVILVFVAAQKLGLIHGVDTGGPSGGSVPVSGESSALDVVNGYYDDWNARQYSAMYALLSKTMKASHPSFSDYETAHEAVSDLRLEASQSSDPSVVKFNLASDQSDANGHRVTSHFIGHWSLIRINGAWRLDDEQIEELQPPASPVSLHTEAPALTAATATVEPTVEASPIPSESAAAGSAIATAEAEAATAEPELASAPPAQAAVASAAPIETTAPLETPSDPCAAKGRTAVLVANPTLPIDTSIQSDISIYVAPNGSATGVAGNVPTTAISAILSATFVNCSGVGQNIPMHLEQGQLTPR